MAAQEKVTEIESQLAVLHATSQSIVSLTATNPSRSTFKTSSNKNQYAVHGDIDEDVVVMGQKEGAPGRVTPLPMIQTECTQTSRLHEILQSIGNIN